MSAGVTSDPSQPEHPWSWAELSSSEAEVAVILDEAISVAGTGRDSQSPSGIPLSQKLAGEEDLPSQLKSEIIMDKFLREEHL
jgi:hypothetical protein